MQPGNSSVTLSAVDQRLSAMLEELERGLRRTGALEQIVAAPLGDVRPPFDLKKSFRARFGWQKASASDQAVATMFLAAGVVTLILSFALEVLGPQIRTSTSEDALKVASYAARPAAETPAQAVVASPGKNLAAPGFQREEEGLSVEEFERQVRRIFAEKRQKDSTTKPVDEDVEFSLDPDDGAPKTERQSFPEPLAPPIVAPTSGADVAAAQPEYQAAELARPPKAAMRGKTAFDQDKPRRAKIVAKREAKPKTAHVPSQDSVGPASFVAGAADALKGMVKNWTQ